MAMLIGVQKIDVKHVHGIREFRGYENARL